MTKRERLELEKGELQWAIIDRPSYANITKEIARLKEVEKEIEQEKEIPSELARILF